MKLICDCVEHSEMALKAPVIHKMGEMNFKPLSDSISMEI